VAGAPSVSIGTIDTTARDLINIFVVVYLFVVGGLDLSRLAREISRRLTGLPGS
jgi:hypothetical protein